MTWILVVTTLVALLTGGTVYAADQAAPGDLLYPLDRAIENLRLGRPHGGEAPQTRFEAERMQEAGELLQQEDAEDGDKENSRFCDPISADDPHPAGQGLAATYGIDYETIMEWFCHGIDDGKESYGFGEIMLALETAEKTGDSAEALLAQRDEMGWGEIWQELGLIGKPDDDENGPPEENGPPFEVPRGPKEGKGKPEGVPPGPPADRGRPEDAPNGPPEDAGDPDQFSPGPPFEVPGGPPFGSPGGRP